MRLIWFSFLLFASVTTVDAADLRITTVEHHSRILSDRVDYNFRDFDITVTNTTYVHGAMRRYVDTRSKEAARVSTLSGRFHTVFIENCDTRKWIDLDPEAREYVVGRYDPEKLSFARAASEQRVRSSQTDLEDLKMSVETLVADTGETLKIFGHAARHFVRNSHATPSGEAAVFMGMREETTLDAWYIDAELKVPERGCQSEELVTLERGKSEKMQRATRDEKLTGPTPHGFVARSKLVARMSQKPAPAPAGATYLETLESSVTEWSEAPLDPALFEVPPGYNLVKCLRGGDHCR